MATLSDVFASVTVTPEQGVEILGSMAADYSDKDPELVKAFQAAIEKVTNPTPPDPPATHTTTRTSSSNS